MKFPDLGTRRPDDGIRHKKASERAPENRNGQSLLETTTFVQPFTKRMPAGSFSIKIHPLAPRTELLRSLVCGPDGA